MLEASEASPDQPGFLYLVDNTVLLKLGLATDPPKRLCAYTTENPHNENLDVIRCHNYTHAKSLEQEFARLTAEWAWTNGNGNTTEWRERKAGVIHKWIDFKESHGFVNLKEWEERKPFLLNHADNLKHSGRYLLNEFLEMARCGLIESELFAEMTTLQQAMADLEREHETHLHEIKSEVAQALNRLQSKHDAEIRETQADSALALEAAQATHSRERGSLEEAANHWSSRAHSLESTNEALASRLRESEMQVDRLECEIRKKTAEESRKKGAWRYSFATTMAATLLILFSLVNFLVERGRASELKRTAEELRLARDEFTQTKERHLRQYRVFDKYRSDLLVAKAKEGKFLFFQTEEKGPHWYTKNLNGDDVLISRRQDGKSPVFRPKIDDKRTDADGDLYLVWWIEPTSEGFGEQKWGWYSESELVHAKPDPTKPDAQE